MAAKKRTDVDWEMIELDWRAGIKPAMQIGVEHRISHTAINKHFAKLGVPRDLQAKIRAKAEAMVSAAEVSGMISTETTETSAAIINTNATMIAVTIRSHRAGIRRYTKLAETLLEELETTTGNKELFDQLGELLRSESEKGVDKLNDIYQKVIAMPGRVDSFKKLADTLKTLIVLERQAVGLADNSNGDADKPKEPVLTVEQVAARMAFVLQSAVNK